MYYKEKLTKNLADLNTFETSMSLRDRVTTSNEPYSLCLFTYVHTALKWLRGAKILQHTLVREITMTSLGNIALSLKDRVYVFKVRLQCLFFTLLLLLWLKSFLRLVLLLTQLFSSSSDVGVKNLANSLTRDGPMRLRGSS